MLRTSSNQNMSVDTVISWLYVGVNIIMRNGKCYVEVLLRVTDVKNEGVAKSFQEFFRYLCACL